MILFTSNCLIENTFISKQSYLRRNPYGDVSFIYARGPRTVPWDTPNGTLTKLD